MRVIQKVCEIINEAIILPLFYFIGKVVLDKKELINRIKAGLLITLCVYLLLSSIVIIFIEPLLKIMATSENIISESITYIRIESVANIFLILSSFVLVTLGKEKHVYNLTFIKLFLCIILDIFLVSTLKILFNLGVNGIAFSNIIVNLFMFFVTLGLLYKQGIKLLNKEKLDFKWSKRFFKIGGISGIESFVTNIFTC